MAQSSCIEFVINRHSKMLLPDLKTRYDIEMHPQSEMLSFCLRIKTIVHKTSVPAMYDDPWPYLDLT
jgi:hypothetical protein